MTRTDENIPILDLHPKIGSIRDEVLEGLSSAQKTLPCKYLYDKAGSVLFDRICEVKDYYPTRTELSIIEACADKIRDAIGPRAMVIEPGSGSAQKISMLLDLLEDPAAYVPIEISKEHLRMAAAKVAEAYPDVEVLPVCADFTGPVPVPKPSAEVRRKIIFFPGSTIGNFAPDEADVLLPQLVRAAGPAGGILIGIDLKKDREVLERAYDDDEGVTAEFNLNLLRRLNTELDADFDVDAFRHESRYNEHDSRVEMHLVSLADQTVTIGDERFRLRKGETIHTENSHKFEIDEFAARMERHGARPSETWTDPRGYFGLLFFEVASD